MNLKPEVIRVLEREKRVCERAIARLRERYHPLERQYGWSTDEFLEKFNAGTIGDDQEFFLGTLWRRLSRTGKQLARVWKNCSRARRW